MLVFTIYLRVELLICPFFFQIRFTNVYSHQQFVSILIFCILGNTLYSLTFNFTVNILNTLP